MRLAQTTAPKPAEPDSVAAEAVSQAGDTPDTPQQNAILPPPQAPPVKISLSPAISAKERKTADESAAMIFTDLREIGCPKRGIKVTVYGSNHGIRGCRSAAKPARPRV